MAIIISIEGTSMTLASGAKTIFRFPIGNAIEFGDVIVVRLQIPRGTIFNENVYGVGADGNIIWQIQQEYPSTWDGAWGGLENIDGKAVLSNSESQIRHVDPKTGIITQRGMSVR